MMSRTISDPGLPAEMTMHLYSSNAGAIHDDSDWLKARIYLGALFRKHGPFSIEILKKGIWVGAKRVDGVSA